MGIDIKRFALVTAKSWHLELFNILNSRDQEEWLLISSRDQFTPQVLNDFKPEKVFIPHWSYIIPASVYDNFECIVFHMTDLPYGRGGSPLQNLIVRGHKETMISAIQVEAGLDTGDVYMKMPLILSGTAQEIFIRATDVIQNMIEKIISDDPQPIAQTGEITEFKRRKKSDGDIKSLDTIDQVYDYIRMLDCEGYPPAFLETENFKFEFKKVTMNPDKSINADVRIVQK